MPWCTPSFIMIVCTHIKFMFSMHCVYTCLCYIVCAFCVLMYIVCAHIHAVHSAYMCTQLFVYPLIHCVCMCEVFPSINSCTHVLTCTVKLDKKKQRSKEHSLSLQHAAQSSGGYY